MGMENSPPQEGRNHGCEREPSSETEASEGHRTEFDATEAKLCNAFPILLLVPKHRGLWPCLQKKYVSPLQGSPSSTLDAAICTLPSPPEVEQQELTQGNPRARAFDSCVACGT